MNYKTQYTLLTFYKFVDIDNPATEVKKHLVFCKDIGIKGRIYIGEEGISATVSCNKGQLEAYRLYLQYSQYFSDIADIDIKASAVKKHAFDRMVVKYRKEIVTLGMTVNQSEVENAYQKISVDAFKKIVDSQDPEYEILDMRNTYEYKLGHFKSAIPAATINFREVQDLTEKYLEKFAQKKVIMYCTGGIRCEKLSVLLKNKGITNFYALDGGVVKYVNTHNDGNWLGNLYTFDNLVSTKVGDHRTHTPIGECIYTGKKTDFVENCRYSDCNARIIANKRAYKQHLGLCSQECFDKAKQDILLKTDLSMDPHDYIQIRGDIKAGKRDFETTRQEIADRLDMKLCKSKCTFNHTVSQKEDIVDSCVINDYYGQ